MSEVPNRLLPRAIIEPTDNSVVLTLTNREGGVVSQNSFKAIKEASEYYQKVCEEVLKDAEEQVKEVETKDD